MILAELRPADRTDMEKIAIEVAGMNKAAAAGITILNADIEFGQWDFVNRSLTVTERSTGRRARESPQG